MATTVMAVDSAQGHVDTDPGVAATAPTSVKGFKTFSFKKRYVHYIGNSTAVDEHIVLDLNTSDATPHPVSFIHVNEGYHGIPYTSVGASMTGGEWAKVCLQGCRIRIKELGFNVIRSHTLLENYVPRAGSTVIENMFESKPLIQHFQDPDNLMQPGTIARTEGQLVQNIETLIDSQFKSFYKVNNELTHTEPTDMAAGMLPYADWYFYNVNGAMTNDVDLAGAFDLYQFVDMKYAKEGEQFGHNWVNPAPKWHALGTSRQVALGGQYNGPLEPWQADGPLSGSRAQLLVWPYMHDYWRFKKGHQAYYAFMDDSASAWQRNNFLMNHSSQQNEDDCLIPNCMPPNYFLRMNRVHGPQGQLNMMAQIMIEYTSVIEIEEPRGPFTDYPLRVLPSNDAPFVPASYLNDAGLQHRVSNWGWQSDFGPPGDHYLRHKPGHIDPEPQVVGGRRVIDVNDATLFA